LAVGDGKRVLIGSRKGLAIEEFRGSVCHSHAARVASFILFEDTNKSEISDLDTAANKQQILRFDVSVLNCHVVLAIWP
jgi:hypothetical protein